MLSPIGHRGTDRTVLFLPRFCFIKLNLLLIAIEIAGDDGVDTTIAINPDSNVKIDLNFQGFFIAESADDVKRFVASDLAACNQLPLNSSVYSRFEMRSGRQQSGAFAAHWPTYCTPQVTV